MRYFSLMYITPICRSTFPPKNSLRMFASKRSAMRRGPYASPKTRQNTHVRYTVDLPPQLLTSRMRSSLGMTLGCCYRLQFLHSTLARDFCLHYKNLSGRICTSLCMTAVTSGERLCRVLNFRRSCYIYSCFLLCRRRHREMQGAGVVTEAGCLRCVDDGGQSREAVSTKPGKEVKLCRGASFRLI